MSDKKYLFVGEHAETLASGQPVAPGEPVPAAAVDPEDPHDQHLLEQGVLIEVAEARREARETGEPATDTKEE